MSLLQSLSIAHFNEGVEHEHLREYADALSSYESSKDYAERVCEQTGASNDAMLQNAHRSLQEVALKHLHSQQARTRRVSKRETLDTMRHFKDPAHIKNIDATLRERFDSMMGSLLSKMNRENKDEVSIQHWNEMIGRQFKDYNYARFFFRRPARQFVQGASQMRSSLMESSQGPSTRRTLNQQSEQRPATNNASVRRSLVSNQRESLVS